MVEALGLSAWRWAGALNSVKEWEYGRGKSEDNAVSYHWVVCFTSFQVSQRNVLNLTVNAASDFSQWAASLEQIRCLVVVCLCVHVVLTLLCFTQWKTIAATTCLRVTVRRRKKRFLRRKRKSNPQRRNLLFRLEPEWSEPKLKAMEIQLK